MYRRLTFWTGSIAYISALFMRFTPHDGHSSAGLITTASFLGALVGFGLGCMFANRVKRKHF
jgi:hypothetical protein